MVRGVGGRGRARAEIRHSALRLALTTHVMLRAQTFPASARHLRLGLRGGMNVLPEAEPGKTSTPTMLAARSTWPSAPDFPRRPRPKAGCRVPEYCVRHGPTRLPMHLLLRLRLAVL